MAETKKSTKFWKFNFWKTTFPALKYFAGLVLRKYKPRVILVTGNVGKTSTKDAIASALSGSFSIRKTEENNNNEFGSIFVVLGVNTKLGGFRRKINCIYCIFKLLLIRQSNYPQCLVIEVGIRKKGDMKNSVGWIESDAVALTQFVEQPSHLEFFANKSEMLDEKLVI